MNGYLYLALVLAVLAFILWLLYAQAVAEDREAGA